MTTWTVIPTGLQIYRSGQLVAEIGVDQFINMIAQMSRVLWRRGV